MMTCDEIQPTLSAYRDDEGSPLLRWRTRMHLKDCAECRAALERLDILCALLEPAPPTPELSADFAQRVMAQARRHQAENSAPRRASLPYRLAAAAGVLLVGVGGGVLLSDPLWGQAGSASETVDTRALIDPFDEAPWHSLSSVYPSLGELSSD